MYDADTLLSTVLDGLADPVFVKDENHIWLYANDAFCRFVGIPREKILGFTDADYFPPEQVEVFYRIDDQVFAAGGVHENEELLIGPDGSNRTIRTKKSVVTAPSGRQVLVGVIRDITALRHAEDEAQRRRRAKIRAEEANAAKSRFLTNMSHELRTPINAIVGYTELLEELVEDEEAGHCTAQVLAASSSLVGMVDQILDLSRIEAGNAVLHVEAIDLRQLLTDAKDRLEPAASKVGSHIRVDGDAPIPLSTDRSALLGVVLNLGENALKYASPGTVVLRAAATADAVHIEVHDDGPGVAPEQLGLLFDKFWRANPEGRTPGSGLGLSIVREVTAQLGGKVEVDDRDAGGMCFRLVLPHAPPTP